MESDSNIYKEIFIYFRFIILKIHPSVIKVNNMHGVNINTECIYIYTHFETILKEMFNKVTTKLFISLSLFVL